MPTTNILDLNNRLAKLEKKSSGAGGAAEDVGYDNSTSHLTADNVQAAIDEVVSDIAGLDAEDVSYDNTNSGLTATDVQAAIDEVAGDISGISADDVTYDNTDSGLTADTVQDAIDEVNDDLGDVNSNLNGFKFYPAGTAIVGLVSDDSPYTDTDGNYILAASTTGQSMIDDVTYKSINSTVDCRGKVGADTLTPFKSGGGGGDEAPTLLWTNPDTSLAFAQQTVSIDLSEYKSVCIDYRVSNSGTERHAYAFYSIGDNITIPATAQGYPTVIGTAYGKVGEMSSTARNISISTNGITFGTGYAGAQAASTSYAIPAKIYGIKTQIYPTI